MWSCLTFEEIPTIAVIASLSTNKRDISKWGDNLLICIGIFTAYISYFFCSCDKTLWPKKLKEHLFVLAVPEGEETIMVGKHGRRQQARQPKGSESFQLQMQAPNKISKLAVVKGFNTKVRFQELTYSTQLQLVNLLKEHPHVRTKYSNDQEYRGYFSLKPCYYFVYRSCSGLQ